MQKGFTFIEILLVMAIVVSLFAMTLGNLNSVQQNTNQNSSEEILLSDIKLQQLKSISGDLGQDTSFLPYGVYFGTNTYTLFRGNTYSSSDPNNFTVELSANLSFNTVEFADSEIIFAKNSGEIIGFTNGNDSISITNSITGRNTTITLNRLGVITNVQ